MQSSSQFRGCLSGSVTPVKLSHGGLALAVFAEEPLDMKLL